MAARNDIRLNEMSSLLDLGLFPLTVCAGAVANVVLTLVVTRLVVQSGLGINLAEWIAIVLALNLLPVILLRWLTLRPTAPFRPVREMSFLADQHRFPRWVYALASLNMAFWVTVSWFVFQRPDNPPVHLLLLAAAIVVTGFPAWARIFRRG
jgi:hypothetical protein